MTAFLVTCLGDEGMSPSRFVVIEASSRLAIAEHMLAQPERWESFLCWAYEPRESPRSSPRTLWQLVLEQAVTPEALLALLDQTHIDGDSAVQVRVWDFTVTPLAAIETDPWKRGLYRTVGEVSPVATPTDAHAS